ncbi:MAG: hypothetical protein CVT78_03560 [Alphaproteobacteria bacterium HGW-Alphaproteobacteria-17]|nr:MAG: hypothetical protein CVT78_03560 [Alphaproteobacteria bacterium HGW-Alphaproteobacteria-17]
MRGQGGRAVRRRARSGATGGHAGIWAIAEARSANTSSLRAQRSNPERCTQALDCFAALAMTDWILESPALPASVAPCAN